MNISIKGRMWLVTYRNSPTSRWPGATWRNFGSVRFQAQSTSAAMIHGRSSTFNPCWLVVSTPLENMKVNGKDYPIYYGKKHVPNHQPDEWFVHIYLYPGRVRFVDSWFLTLFFSTCQLPRNLTQPLPANTSCCATQSQCLLIQSWLLPSGKLT